MASTTAGQLLPTADDRIHVSGIAFERLWVMRRLVFGLGSLQVVLCAAVLAGVAMFFGQNRISAGVIGLAVAMSSTAVVIQVELQPIAAPAGALGGDHRRAAAE